MPLDEETRKGSVLVVPYGDFVSSFIPLYAGSQVRVCIGSKSQEYKLSKSLLCKQSPYFRAAFEGRFQEGEEQSITLTEEDGVVSIQSFEMLVQWLYLGQVIFGAVSPQDKISAILEFVRFADMCGVTSVQATMGEELKAVIVAHPAPANYGYEPSIESNTHCLLSQHIMSASFLPYGHSVRAVLAQASVEGYLTRATYKFRQEAQDIPNFSVDLLHAVRETLQSGLYFDHDIQFKDPISGKLLSLRHRGV